MRASLQAWGSRAPPGPSSQAALLDHSPCTSAPHPGPPRSGSPLRGSDPMGLAQVTWGPRRRRGCRKLSTSPDGGDQGAVLSRVVLCCPVLPCVALPCAVLTRVVLHCVSWCAQEPEKASGLSSQPVALRVPAAEAGPSAHTDCSSFARMGVFQDFLSSLDILRP